jgi:hypothetical protein
MSRGGSALKVPSFHPAQRAVLLRGGSIRILRLLGVAIFAAGSSAFWRMPGGRRRDQAAHGRGRKGEVECSFAGDYVKAISNLIFVLDQIY